MVIAGIDEAGYGPVLGPLASAACAFRTPDGDADAGADTGAEPCLWKRLRRAVGKSRSRDGRKLHVNDSKAVYTPAAGLAELERAVLCFIGQARGAAADLDGFLRAADPDVQAHLDAYAWYAPADGEAFPLATAAAAVAIASNAYAAVCAAADTRCVHYRVRLLPERQFNDHTARTRNKASTLFSLAAQHLDDLLRAFAGEDLLIVCDRQGGRAHYGPLLRLMFEEWSLTVVAEADASSAYVLTNGPRRARIVFREKAEASCLPVAAASMLAKYSREVLMHRFNRYWQSHDASLKPTAGYYNDGLRFLKDIEPLRQKLNVADVDLIRQR